MEIFRRWMSTVFSDTQLVILFLVLVVSGAIVLSVGNLLAVIASVVISFLLEGLVRFLVGFRWPRMLAVVLVFGLFMLFLAVMILALVPLLVSQITDLIDNIPWIVSKARTPSCICPGSIRS